MYRHIFDRSNLDEVVAYNPATKENITRRDDLLTGMCPRTDIVLFNGTRLGKQYSLFVTDIGFAGDTWLLDMLTNDEYEQVTGIAQRMRRNAREFAPAMKLLGR